MKVFFGNGSRWGAKIDYSLEDKELSTMGPLKLIKDLPNNFLVMNADVLTDLNYKNFFNYHLKNQNLFTISSHIRNEMIDYGVLIRGNKQNLKAFKEKPVEEFMVSMGIYAVNKKILDFIPKNKKFGFDNLMNKLLNKRMNISFKIHNNSWLDIGRPEDYLKATEIFQKKKKSFIND